MKNNIYISVIIALIFTSCFGYNPDKPDTARNKKGFKSYLKVNITPDVKDIYAFGDFLGIDYTVYFSFSCDSVTIRKIMQEKKLKPADKNNRIGIESSQGYNFKWWNEERIKELVPYENEYEYSLQQYLWYDSENKKAYYIEYSR